MADKSISKSNIGGDTKNKKLKGSCKVPADDALSDKKFDKGLEISFKKPNVIKPETDFELLNNMFNNKSTSLCIRTLKKGTTPASTPKNISVKKEIITDGKAGEEPVSKVSEYNPTPIKPAKPLNVPISEKNGDKSGNQEPADENTNEANVIRLTAKDLSNEERKILRAKRFNMADESSQNDERTIQAPKHVFERTNILGCNNPTPTFNTLKKRAERFGENVSSVMKKLEHKEKLLKRKLKFLESVTSLKELEMKKEIDERFGLA